MTIEKFIEQISDILDETSGLTPQTCFRELPEWNSLRAIFIFTMIQEEYGVTLKGSDIQKTSTIQDIFKMIEEKQ